jgi:hypothetical protein
VPLASRHGGALVCRRILRNLLSAPG